MAECSFAYKVVIEDYSDTICVVEYVCGHDRNSTCFVGCTRSHNIAKACRKAAYDLLARADGVEHSDDFYPEIDVNEQIALMLEENER